MEEETEDRIQEEDVAQSYKFDAEITNANCDVPMIL